MNSTSSLCYALNLLESPYSVVVVVVILQTKEQTKRFQVEIFLSSITLSIADHRVERKESENCYFANIQFNRFVL